MRKRDFYNKAIKAWGNSFLYDMMIEESAELIHALQHFKRRQEGSFTKVLSEVADLDILIEQFKITLLNQIWEYKTIKSRKIKRAIKRLNGTGVLNMAEK